MSLMRLMPYGQGMDLLLLSMDMDALRARDGSLVALYGYGCPTGKGWISCCFLWILMPYGQGMDLLLLSMDMDALRARDGSLVAFYGYGCPTGKARTPMMYHAKKIGKILQ
jgi:hypothetical protein